MNWLSNVTPRLRYNEDTGELSVVKFSLLASFLVEKNLLHSHFAIPQVSSVCARGVISGLFDV